MLFIACVTGNLVVEGKLVDPQQSGGDLVLSINTTAVFGNTAVRSQGSLAGGHGFYSCSAPLPFVWWASHGNRYYNNTFFTPGSPNLPFTTSGCNTTGTTLAQWQALGVWVCNQSF